jgi:hypothetical protein
MHFPGVIPRTPSKGGEDGRGLGTQMGRRGVVCDKEGEEGMRVIQRKGMGRKEWEEGKERRKMTGSPQTKFLDPPLIAPG